MERIEVNIQTGDQKIVQLTEQEITQAQAQYAEWLASQPTKEDIVMNAEIESAKQRDDRLLAELNIKT